MASELFPADFLKIDGQLIDGPCSVALFGGRLVPDGEFQLFYPDGVLGARCKFREGQLGEVRLYDRSGKEVYWAEGNYDVDGRFNGWSHTADPDREVPMWR